MRRRELICSLGAIALTKGLGSAIPSQVSQDERPSSTRAAQHSDALIVAGVRLVDSRIAKAPSDLAHSVSPPYLYNHAVRTFLFASLAGKATGQKFDAEMLYLACILHDLGLTEKFQGDLPFEIQGAEVAKRFLEENGYEPNKAAVVWDGIAMHASMIGHFKQAEVSLVGVGAGG
jgi:HD domain